MTPDQPTSSRLESLEARWESDKGSRIFLQLADEYRRLGRLEDAAKVLQEGLQASPGHLGARVARGRCLIDLGRAQEAVADLEKVIQADPTQMVAYRLLVQAYIQTGDGKTAGERLRVYSLLNDADPEIEELSARIEALRSGGAASGTGEAAPPTPPRPEAPPPVPLEPAAEAGAPDQDVQPAPEPEPAQSAEPDEPAPPPRPPSPLRQVETMEKAFEEVLPAELPPLRMPSPVSEAPVSPERTAPHDQGDLVPPEAPVAAAAEDPFPDVGAPEPPAAARAGGPSLDPFPALGFPEDERRYLTSMEPDLLGGGAELEAEPREPVGAVPEQEAAVPATEEPPAEVPGGGPVLSDAPEPVAEAAPVEEPEAEASSAEPFEMEPPGLDLGAPVGGEPARGGPGEGAGPFDLAPPVEEALPEAEVPNAPSEPVEEASGRTEPSEPAVEARPRHEEGGATVTLGRLYLRQGHLGEAEAIFREILERNPDDREARAGLEEVAAQVDTGGLSGKDLLVGFDGSTHGEGLTARKRYALERYLALIRGSGGDVH